MTDRKRYTVDEAATAWGISIEGVKRRLIRAEKHQEPLGVKDKHGRWAYLDMAPDEFERRRRRRERHRIRFNLLSPPQSLDYELGGLIDAVEHLRAEIAELKGTRERQLDELITAISRLAAALPPKPDTD